MLPSRVCPADPRGALILLYQHRTRSPSGPARLRRSPVIRIGIVDDDPLSRQFLLDHVHRFEQEHGQAFDVRTFDDGRAIAAPYVADFDIVFLDVEMEHLDGFATARRIREVDPEVVLVFITNMAQFAIRGYEVDALSYLLKPVPYFAFSQELSRSLQRARRRGKRSIMLQSAGELVKVDIDDIVYLESIKHRILVHTLDRQITITGTLKDMEHTLDDQRFFRSNSGYLVNLRHVVGVQQSTCILVGGHELLISRPRKKAFLQALTDFVGGRAA